MTFNQGFIEKKLNELKKHHDEIAPLLLRPEKEILGKPLLLHTAERLLQLAVDTMLDINQHFIKELGFEPSDDFHGTFLTLGENKIIPMTFAEKIAPVVGLRNRVVHRYEDLSKKRFIREFKKKFKDFEKYMKYIYVYLQKII